MTSIDDTRELIACHLNAMAGELSAEEFAGHAERLAYAMDFCRLFAAQAPHAWSNLLELAELADAVLVSTLQDQTATQLLATADLNHRTLQWEERYNLATPSHWVAHAGVTTLLQMSASRLFGYPPPTGLERLRFASAKEGQIEVTQLGLHPYWRVPMRVDIGEVVWEPTSESWPVFRDRILTDVQRKLEDQSRAAGIDPATFGPGFDRVNSHWIEWTIEALVNETSPGKIAKSWTTRGTKYSREGVAKGIDSICSILGFTAWSELRAKRDVRNPRRHKQ